MDGSFFFSIGQTLWEQAAGIALALGTCGFYLMLPRGGEPAPRRLRQAGFVFAVLALLSLALLSGRQKAIETSPGSTFSRIAVLTLCSASVVCAAWSVVSVNLVRAALAFVLLLCCDAGLLAIDSMWKPAGVCVVLAAVAGFVAWWKISRQGAEHSSLDDEAGREPLLVCFAAFLFSLMMNGVLREQPLRQEAVLFGGIVLSIGAIGFVTRRGWVAVLLSWGVMTQGALMTLCGLTRLHGSRGGESFLLAGLLVTAIEGIIAVVLLRQFSSAPVEEWHG